MEYLIEGVRNIYHKDCKKFVEINKQLIDDVKYNNYPILNPLFDLKPNTFKELIKNVYGMGCYFLNETLRETNIDINIQMLLLRYYCASNKKNVSLVVLKNKMIDKNEDVYHKIEIKISKKQLEFIELQINFIRMSFDNFSSFLYENQQKFKNANTGQFKETKKTINLNIYVVKNVKKMYKDVVFQSNHFYELVEGSKIFLNAPNYDIFEKQISYAYGIDYENTVRVFFRVRFLKFYLYKHYSLYDMEYYIVSGSYLLFCLGMRVSKDTDIYSLEGPNNKMLDKKKMKCNYDIKHIKNRLFININESSDYDIWNRIILYPEDNYYVFGLKTNSINIEIYKRLGRFHYQKSKKSLSDLLILKYFLNEKLDDIDLRTVNKFENLLFYRYSNFDTKKIINYFIETDAS